MKKLPDHKQYSIFVGVMLSGYNLADKLYGAVYIVLMSMRGIDPLQISIVFAVSSLSLAIFDYPSGNLSDLFGRKKLTAIGFFTWGIGLCLFAFASNLMLFIVSAIIMSLGVALISGSPQAWYIDKLDDLGMLDYKNVVLPRLNGFISAFAIVGAFLATVSSNVHLYLPVAIAGIVAIGLGIYAWFRFTDNYGERTEENIFKEVYNTSVDFAKNKLMRFVLLKSIFSHAALLAFLLTWQVYGVNELHMSVSYLGIILIVFMAVMSVSSFFVSFLAKRKVSPLKIITGGTLISALGLLLVGWFPNPIVFVGGLILFEFGLAMESSCFGAWVQDFIPRSKRATFSSGLSALKSLAGFAITLLLGLLTERLGYSFIWYLGAVSLLISNAVLIYFNAKYVQIGMVQAEGEQPAI